MATKIKIAKWCCVALAALQPLAPGPTWASKQIDAEGMPFKSTLQRTWDAMDRTPPTLSSVIERFDVTRETIPSAVVRLANEQGVLCGFYLVPWPEAQPGTSEPFISVSATFQDATLAQILDALVSLDPRFTWWEERGVINVALASAVDHSAHPLNVRLPLFAADEVPYLLALFAGGDCRDRITPAPLFEELYLTTGLLVGMAGSGPRLELYPPVTVTAESWTTVEILNEIAWQLKLPWYIVDRRMLGGRDIGFSMGVDLLPLPTARPALQSAVEDTVVTAGQETPLPSPSHEQEEADDPAGTATATASAAPSSAVLPLRASLAPQRTASAVKGRTHIAVVEGARVAALNGVPVKLPQAATLRDGRMFVPQALLRLVTEAAAGTA